MSIFRSRIRLSLLKAIARWWLLYKSKQMKEGDPEETVDLQYFVLRKEYLRSILEPSLPFQEGQDFCQMIMESLLLARSREDQAIDLDHFVLTITEVKV